MDGFVFLDNQDRLWNEAEALAVGLELSGPMQSGLEDLHRGEIHVRSRNFAQTERALRNRGLITTGRSRPCILTNEGKAVRQALRNHRRNQ